MEWGKFSAWISEGTATLCTFAWTTAPGRASPALPVVQKHFTSVAWGRLIPLSLFPCWQGTLKCGFKAPQVLLEVSYWILSCPKSCLRQKELCSRVPRAQAGDTKSPLSRPLSLLLSWQWGKQCYLCQWYLWAAWFLSITVPGESSFRFFFSSLKHRLSSLLSRGLAHRVSLQTGERTPVNSAVTARGKWMSFHSPVKCSGLCDCTHSSHIQPLLSWQIKNLFFPRRLLLLLQWWFHSQYFLELWLKEIKFLRYGKL